MSKSDPYQVYYADHFQGSGLLGMADVVISEGQFSKDGFNHQPFQYDQIQFASRSAKRDFLEDFKATCPRKELTFTRSKTEHGFTKLGVRSCYARADALEDFIAPVKDVVAKETREGRHTSKTGHGQSRLYIDSRSNMAVLHMRAPTTRYKDMHQLMRDKFDEFVQVLGESLHEAGMKRVPLMVCTTLPDEGRGALLVLPAAVAQEFLRKLDTGYTGVSVTCNREELAEIDAAIAEKKERSPTHYRDLAEPSVRVSRGIGIRE